MAKAKNIIKDRAKEERIREELSKELRGSA